MTKIINKIENSDQVDKNEIAMTKCDGSENRVTKKELYLFKWKWGHTRKKLGRRRRERNEKGVCYSSG